MNNQDPSNEFHNQNPFSGPSHPLEKSNFALPRNRAVVLQVKPLCICMIIQGGMEILMGILFASMGVFVPLFMNQQGAVGQIPAEQQDTVRAVLVLTYGGIGVTAAFAGAFRIFGGWRGLNFQSHRIGMISHFVGLFSFVSCYCLPTSVALCIWGCIVYRKPDVKNAFLLGEQGYSMSEIETGLKQPPANS